MRNPCQGLSDAQRILRTPETRDFVIDMTLQELSLPLTTDRLRLRAYRDSDAEALLPVYSREDVARFLLCEPWTAEVARAEVSKRIPRTGLDTEARALALVIETADGLESIEGSVVIGDIAIWFDGESSRRPRSAGFSTRRRAGTDSPPKPPSPCSTPPLPTTASIESSLRWMPETPPRRGWPHASACDRRLTCGKTGGQRANGATRSSSACCAATGSRYEDSPLDTGPHQVTRVTKGLGNNPKTSSKVHETGL